VQRLSEGGDWEMNRPKPLAASNNGEFGYMYVQAFWGSRILLFRLTYQLQRLLMKSINLDTIAAPIIIRNPELSREDNSTFALRK
jgi:hypothetical protein